MGWASVALSRLMFPAFVNICKCSSALRVDFSPGNRPPRPQLRIAGIARSRYRVEASHAHLNATQRPAFVHNGGIAESLLLSSERVVAPVYQFGGKPYCKNAYDNLACRPSIRFAYCIPLCYKSEARLLLRCFPPLSAVSPLLAAERISRSDR
jgi:hypothetical protein